MDKKKNREIVGIGCIILGGLFIIAGLVFFVLNNRNNLYGKKVTATILSSVEADVSRDESKKKETITLLTVMYRVGNENVTTTYNYPGKIGESAAFIILYYDARNPKRIIEAGWTFEALFLALLGVVIFLLGLYYKGITDFGIVEMKKPDKSAPESEKKRYEARERIANGIFPTLGGLVFIAFGVVMLLTRRNYWMLIFIIIGALVILYFSLLIVPAFIELHQLKVAKKFKGTVVNTDSLGDDSEKDDKDDKEDKKEEDLVEEDQLDNE
ncbi:MAG: DUF3592 domain-containing protein [Lachnospiraceae bacterium]|nr:DUF3592 domain-containing protein [Lachnospiraceae bacterium]